MKRKPILASATLLAFATAIARLFGFFRTVVLAATYGAGSVSDAFVIAFTVPDIVLALVGASISAAFIPVYTRIGENKAKITSNIITMTLFLGLLFSLVFTIIPQALTYLFASQLDPVTFALTTGFLRMMVWSAIPILVVPILQSYLQIQNAFFFAAINNVPVNLAAITAIILSKSTGLLSVMGYGVIIGNIIRLFYMLIMAKKKGYVYKPTLDIRAPELREFFALMVPIMLSTLIQEINLIIDRNFASSLVSGSISALNYASRVVNLFTALIGSTLATVLFPFISELSAQGKTIEIRGYLSSCIKKLIPILLPAMVCVILLAEPLVNIMYERGSFSSYDTRRTAEATIMYAPLIVAANLNTILTRVLFSLHDTKTPAIISGVSILIGIMLKFFMIGPLAHIGLALASSITGLITMVALLFILKKYLGGLELKSNNWEWIKTIAATIIMGIAIGLGNRIVPVMSSGMLLSILYYGGLAIFGIIVYIVLHILLRTIFINDVIGLIRGLLNR